MLNVRAFSVALILLTAFFPLSAYSAGVVPAPTAGEVVSVEGVVFIRQDGRKTAAGIKPAKPGDRVVAGDVINTSSNGKVKLLMKDRSIVDLGPSALFKVDHFSANTGKDRELDVSMMYGTMRTSVTQKIEGKGRFKVRTPTATMGVRGTEFIVKSEVRNLDEVRHVLMNPDKPLPASAPEQKVDDLSKVAPGAPAPTAISKTEITVIQGQVDVAKKETPKTDLRGRKLASAPEKVVSLTAGMQIATKSGDAQLAKPVTLDTKTLIAMSAVAKVQDNTFSKAVVIDAAGGQSQNGGGGGGGEATRAAMENMITSIANAPTPVITVVVPGVLAPTPFDAPKVGALRKLRIVVVTQ